MVPEDPPDVLAKLWLGATAVVHDSRIQKRPGNQKKMATLNSGTSDVLCKDRAKILDDTVEATTVNQAKGRFQSQILIAKVGDFKDGWVGVPCGETAAALDRRGASRARERQNLGQPAIG